MATMAANTSPSPAGPPRHTPGAGWHRAREVFGDRLPEITEEDQRRADELLAQAKAEFARVYAPGHHDSPTAA
jgi:hypothetical protein